MTHPFSLEGKRILITGASSGLGRAIAIACSLMGAKVVGVGRDLARLEQTRQMLTEPSSHVMVNADLTQASDRERLIVGLEESVDGVVHGAGISRLSPVRLMTQAHLDELMGINVHAPMLLNQGLLRNKRIADEGSILFIASIAAHIGVAGVAGYSGTKGALLAMARCLALEVAKRKIRVNCLSPSLVETPLFLSMVEMSGIESMEQQRNNHPLGFGKPEDVANASVFFLSPASRWITGTTLVMDGGLTIG
jgi:NAD(P)-dependent dehydrogenase (short-subunit alcohol dehydrogenase family)